MGQFPSRRPQAVPQHHQQTQTSVPALDELEILGPPNLAYAVQKGLHVALPLLRRDEGRVRRRRRQWSLERKTIAPDDQGREVEEPRPVEQEVVTGYIAVVLVQGVREDGHAAGGFAGWDEDLDEELEGVECCITRTGGPRPAIDHLFVDVGVVLDADWSAQKTLRAGEGLAVEDVDARCHVSEVVEDGPRFEEVVIINMSQSEGSRYARGMVFGWVRFGQGIVKVLLPVVESAEKGAAPFTVRAGSLDVWGTKGCNLEIALVEQVVDGKKARHKNRASE